MSAALKGPTSAVKVVKVPPTLSEGLVSSAVHQSDLHMLALSKAGFSVAEISKLSPQARKALLKKLEQELLYQELADQEAQIAAVELTFQQEQFEETGSAGLIELAQAGSNPTDLGQAQPNVPATGGLSTGAVLGGIVVGAAAIAGGGGGGGSSDSVGPPPGFDRLFRLTTNIDTVDSLNGGTSGKDFFDGGFEVTQRQLSFGKDKLRLKDLPDAIDETLTLGDVVDGKGGNDRLDAELRSWERLVDLNLNNVDAEGTSTTIVNIEEINIFVKGPIADTEDDTSPVDVDLYGWFDQETPDAAPLNELSTVNFFTGEHALISGVTSNTLQSLGVYAVDQVALELDGNQNLKALESLFVFSETDDISLILRGEDVTSLLDSLYTARMNYAQAQSDTVAAQSAYDNALGETETAQIEYDAALADYQLLLMAAQGTNFADLAAAQAALTAAEGNEAAKLAAWNAALQGTGGLSISAAKTFVAAYANQTDPSPFTGNDAAVLGKFTTYLNSSVFSASLKTAILASFQSASISNGTEFQNWLPQANTILDGSSVTDRGASVDSVAVAAAYAEYELAVEATEDRESDVEVWEEAEAAELEKDTLYQALSDAQDAEESALDALEVALADESDALDAVESAQAALDAAEGFDQLDQVILEAEDGDVIAEFYDVVADFSVTVMASNVEITLANTGNVTIDVTGVLGNQSFILMGYDVSEIVIIGFNKDVGEINLTSFGLDYLDEGGDLIVAQDGANVIISAESEIFTGSITLVNVTLLDLSDTNFTAVLPG